MIDGIKATTKIHDIYEWKKSTGIDLMTSINVDSGEQVRSRSRQYDDGSESYKYWANYQSYNLEVIESIKAGKSIWRLNLRGSIHKAAMNGNNAQRLTWSLLQSELTKIEIDLKIPLNDWKVKNIEYGVNLVRDQPVLPFLSQSLLMHRRQPFGSLNSEKGEAIGFQSTGYQHQLKAYDKALQLKLPNPLMRIEDRVNRMQYLKGQPISLHFIGMYCIQFKIYSSCLEMIQKDGIMILQSTRDGKVSKKHPAISIMQGAIKNILAISDKYGLTPLALGKIKIQDPAGIVKKRGSGKWDF
ncbi:MAG: P27 family phage terminase small subunit [Saprospiraceae bacterium]|nr:P27 family phage terminase small subunit [Saprospiraceae bacterium]